MVKILFYLCSATKQFQNSVTNLNGYPPYPGLTELRELVVQDLMDRLGLSLDNQALVAQGILAPGQANYELVSICSGSVGCSGSIYAHVRYLEAQTVSPRGRLVCCTPCFSVVLPFE